MPISTDNRDSVNAYRDNAEAVAARLGTDPHRGLTDEEAGE